MGVRLVTVKLVPEPVKVTNPGIRVIVQLPVEGKPVNVILPVAT